MSIVTHRARLAALALSLGLGVSAAAHAANGSVDAGQFSCAELDAKVRAEGRLTITARKRNPHGNESVGANTFVSGRRACTFHNEAPSQWKIYARDDEVCTTLQICLPRSLYGGRIR